MGASTGRVVAVIRIVRLLALSVLFVSCGVTAIRRHDTLSSRSSVVSGPKALALSLGFRGSLPPEGTVLALYPFVVRLEDRRIGGGSFDDRVAGCVQARFAEIGVKVIVPRRVAESRAFGAILASEECRPVRGAQGADEVAFLNCVDRIRQSSPIAPRITFVEELGATHMGRGIALFVDCPFVGGICMGADYQGLTASFLETSGGGDIFLIGGHGLRRIPAVSRAGASMPAESGDRRRGGGVDARMTIELSRRWRHIGDSGYVPLALRADLPARCEEQVALVSTEREKTAIRLIDQAMTLSFAAAGVWPTPAAR